MRKLTVPKPLQNLTQEQLAQVHSWFSRFTYAEMARKIHESFNAVISVNQLTRYYARFAKAQLFNTVLYTPLTPADLAALENADPIPDHIRLEQIKAHGLRLAARPDSTPADLKHLADIFTYEDRRHFKEQFAALHEKTLALRERRLELRARKPQPASPPAKL